LFSGLSELARQRHCERVDTGVTLLRCRLKQFRQTAGKLPNGSEQFMFQAFCMLTRLRDRLFRHLLRGAAKAGEFQSRVIKLLLYGARSVRQFEARGSFDFDWVLAHLIEYDAERHTEYCRGDGDPKVGDYGFCACAIVHGELPEGDA